MKNQLSNLALLAIIALIISACSPQDGPLDGGQDQAAGFISQDQLTEADQITIIPESSLKIECTKIDIRDDHGMILFKTIMEILPADQVKSEILGSISIQQEGSIIAEGHLVEALEEGKMAILIEEEALVIEADRDKVIDLLSQICGQQSSQDEPAASLPSVELLKGNWIHKSESETILFEVQPTGNTLLGSMKVLRADDTHQDSRLLFSNQGKSSQLTIEIAGSIEIQKLDQIPTLDGSLTFLDQESHHQIEFRLSPDHKSLSMLSLDSDQKGGSEIIIFIAQP